MQRHRHSSKFSTEVAATETSDGRNDLVVLQPNTLEAPQK
jgi:hypothetical protein